MTSLVVILVTVVVVLSSVATASRNRPACTPNCYGIQCKTLPKSDCQPEVIPCTCCPQCRKKLYRRCHPQGLSCEDGLQCVDPSNGRPISNTDLAEHSFGECREVSSVPYSENPMKQKFDIMFRNVEQLKQIMRIKAMANKWRQQTWRSRGNTGTNP